MSTEDDLEIWTALEPAAEEEPSTGRPPPAPPPEDPVTVHWVCQMFMHGGSWFEDPPECYGEITTLEERADWEARICQVHCPVCSAELLQRDGHAQVDEEGC